MYDPKPLTPEQVKELKTRLLKRKEEILADIQKRLEIVNNNFIDSGDIGDLSVEEIEKQFAIRIADREAKLLKKIEEALKKIEDGTYGICEACGKPIGYERLKLRPVASLCIECKRKQEEMEKRHSRK